MPRRVLHGCLVHRPVVAFGRGGLAVNRPVSAGLYRATTSPCPNQGCHKVVQHDTEQAPQPCCDGCWLEMGVRELLKARAQALTSAEVQEIFEACLDDGDRAFEHPASVALHDLGQRYEIQAAKYCGTGDLSSACLLGGVVEDLEIVREMFDRPQGPVQAPGEPNVLDQVAALKVALEGRVAS